MMEQASQALVARRYLLCEQLCLDALRLAREHADFDRYARILLPLQEARRQRRQIAAEAGVFVLAERRLDAESILESHPQGCLLLTDPPYAREDERSLTRIARERERYVEVLRLGREDLQAIFLHQLEQRGDAALAGVPPDLPPRQRIEALEAVLDEVGDHEIAHQQLAAAAREAARDKEDS